MKLFNGGGFEAHDRSLTPGRHVGVTLEKVYEDFDAALQSIHIDLIGLNEAAARLAKRIARNPEELGV